MMKLKMLAVLTLMAGLAMAEKQPYERYQTIVDRQMFGPLPANFDPTKSPSEVAGGRGAEKELSREQEQLKSAIHFSMINVTPDGATAVGFTDNSNAKTPVHYYLKVGETRDGWLVKEADAETATMTIAKGDIEVTLTIGGDSAKGAGTTAKTGLNGLPPSSRTGGRANPHLGMMSGRGNNLLGGANTLSRRRMQRQEEARKAAEEAKAQREELNRQREEEKARREEEKAQREEERKAMQAQLESLKEEMKKQREEKAKQEAEGEEKKDDENNDAE